MLIYINTYMIGAKPVKSRLECFF